MSAMGDKKLDAGKKKKQFKGSNSGSADWQAVTPAILVAAIAAVARAGGALRFGYSRDGGVFALGVMGDGEPYTLWERDPAQLDITLGELTEYFTDMVKTTDVTPERKKPM